MSGHENRSAESMNRNLAPFAEVQRMPLVIFDHELFCAPGSFMHVLHKTNPISLQRVCGGLGIVCFKIEMEVLAAINKFDRRVFFVYEF